MLEGGWKADSALTEKDHHMVTGLHLEYQEKAGEKFAHFQLVTDQQEPGSRRDQLHDITICLRR